MLRISIPEPCQEKWEEMTPVEKGAYCKSCCKEVVDFTSMSDVELSSYLKNNNTQSACGRFRNDQLNKPILDISPDVIYMNIPLWKKFIAALFICFSTFIIGCDNKNEFPSESRKIASTDYASSPETILSYLGNAAPVYNTKKIKKVKNVECVEVSVASGRYYVVKDPTLGSGFSLYLNDQPDR